ncbi:MAG: hypothetical protein QNI84_07635 [Henriciella sp.]|nr:hypothetical protein [Henriciella sp.]
MKNRAVIGGGVLALIVVLVAVSFAVFGGGSAEQDEAEHEKRIDWLEQRAELLSEDFVAGLAPTGLRPSDLQLTSAVFDQTEHRVVLLAEADNTLVLVSPPNIRIDLLERVCPAYRRSGLHPSDVAVTFKLQNQNGDAIRSDTVSRTVCRQMRDFKKRAAS